MGSPTWGPPPTSPSGPKRTALPSGWCHRWIRPKRGATLVCATGSDSCTAGPAEPPHRGGGHVAVDRGRISSVPGNILEWEAEAASPGRRGELAIASGPQHPGPTWRSAPAAPPSATSWASPTGTGRGHLGPRGLAPEEEGERLERLPPGRLQPPGLLSARRRGASSGASPRPRGRSRLGGRVEGHHGVPTAARGTRRAGVGGRTGHGRSVRSGRSGRYPFRPRTVVASSAG